MTDVFASIQRPTLLLDEQRARQNIKNMANKAMRSGARFRPHFKTHQSAVIGEWFREEGVEAITVSSIDMAHYFAAHGWDDITIAFPVNVRQMDDLNSLAERTTLNLLVESERTAQIMSEALRFPVKVWLKVDTGYGRTGLKWDDYPSMERIVATLGAGSNGHLQLVGLLSHFGHTYTAGTPGKIVEIFNQDVSKLDAAKKYLAQLGHDVAISVGDTPSCSLVETFAGVDEVRPGNFVFYDLSQLSYGVCQEEEIAVALACPVVAKHPARGQIVIHGGAVHLSLDRLSWKGGDSLFGAVALAGKSGWTRIFDDSYLRSLSQEHGIVHAEVALFDQVNVGDLLMVIPVHSCLTADLMGHYLTLAGKPVEMMPRPSPVH